jgi:anti-sigma B factor antagonist
MNIRIKKYREVYLLILEGELDLYHSHEMEKLFLKLCDSGADRFVIDFSGIRYIDSSGVGTLIKLKNLGIQRGLALMFSGITGEAYNVLSLANLLDFFPRETHFREALKKLSALEPSGSGKGETGEN